MQKQKNNLGIILLLTTVAAMALFFILKRFKVKKSAAEILGVGNLKNGKMKTYFDFKTKYTGDLDVDLEAFTKEAEGGTVTAKTDAASKYFKVTDKEPVHTNIGITRQIFDKYAKLFGYDNSYLNFLKMPADIWNRIFNDVYRKYFNKISDESVINDYVAMWGWGSGQVTAMNSLKKFLTSKGVNSLNELMNKFGKLETLNQLVLWRMDFLKNVPEKYNPRDDKNPNGIYTDGWLNREANFFNIFAKYVS